MSKERAKRRAAREHEAALRAAARAMQAERRERSTARRNAVASVTTGRLPRFARTGRSSGPLARRRRVRTSLLVVLLLTVNILIWVMRPDWESRLAAAVVTVLVAPVLRTLLFPPR